MYKIIGADQKEYGPSTADEIRQYVAEGRADGSTLVQAVGSNDWKPLASFPEFANLTFLSPPPVITEDIGTRTFSLGSCLSRSAKLLMSNFGLLVGATFVIWLLDSVISLIPLLGGVLHLLLYGVLFGGLYHVYLQCIRGGQPTVGESFTGFTKSTQQLMLVGLVSMLLTQIGALFCFIPFVYLIVAWIFCIPITIDRGLEFWSAMELSRKTVTRHWFKMFALLFLAFLPFILFNLYITVETAKMMFEVMNKNQSLTVESFSEIVKATFKWQLIAKVILLFNYPFALGAICHAYEDLLGPRKPR